MKVIVVTYHDVVANTDLQLRVPDGQIYSYWPDPADSTKTLVRHAYSGSQVYQSRYDGTADDLTAALTS